MKVLIETNWLKNNLYKDNITIIDSSWYLPNENRNCYKEYLDNHIPGSFFIDIDNLSNKSSSLPHMLPKKDKFEKFVRMCGVNNNSKVIIYDTRGVWSSPRLWWMFKYFGFNNAFILNGGLLKWKKEDKTLTKEKSKKKFGNFKSKINTNYLANKDEIIKNLDSKKLKIIDARSKNRFLGKEKEPRKGLKSGHIPGSKNIHWKEFINNNGTIKSNEQINSIFLKSKINKNHNIITTCGSGISACILFLALQNINFKNIRVYDGSWSEWGQI